MRDVYFFLYTFHRIFETVRNAQKILPNENPPSVAWKRYTRNHDDTEFTIPAQSQDEVCEKRTPDIKVL